MLMPGIARPPLPEHTERIRQEISSLPEHDRRLLARWMLSDRSQANDARHREQADRFDRDMKRSKRVDPRQLTMMGVEA